MRNWKKNIYIMFKNKNLHQGIFISHTMRNWKTIIPQCSFLLNASLKYTININDLWVDEADTIVVKVHINVYIECR